MRTQPNYFRWLKRRWWLVILLLGLGLWLGGAFKSRTAETTYWAPVTRGNIEETVTAQGTLEAKNYVDVGAQVSGQLQKLYVEIGDTVKKGQLLAQIDPKVYQATEESAKAKLNSLKAQLEQQKAQAVLTHQIYLRDKTLIKAKAIAKQELEEALANDKVAVASVASLKAQVAEQQSTLNGAEANLSYTKIYSPMDGTVTAEPLREGQTINSMQSAPTILQVADLDVMTVRAQVAEADIGRVKEGMPAYFTTLASNERRWESTVRQVEPTPETVNDVVLYDALIDADNKDRALMLTMSAQVFFVIGHADNALLVPTTALTKPQPKEDNAQGKAYLVRVKTDGKPADKLVHIGLMTRTGAEVVDGLAEGDMVMVPQAVSGTGSTHVGGRKMAAMGPHL